jgi:hypothetical protein
MKIALLFGLLSSFVLGIICLLWPERIQEYALRWAGQGLGRLNPFLDWMRTKNYILSIRFVGTLAIIGFIVMLITFIRNTR